MAVQTQDIVVADATSVSSSIQSPGIDLSQWDRASFQAIYSYIGGDTSMGNALIQSSVDGFTWSDYPNSTLGYSSTNATNVWEIKSLPAKFYRVVHVYNSGTGGQVTVKAHFVKETK